jgi:hypothetical protein
MALIIKPNTFTVGAVIVASEHNSNFDTLYNDYNGNVDNNNISGTAGIVDSKLAQITTASKVSGAAITLLTSVPSGAGELPLANIPSIDEDDMVSDSDTALPTQQSVKAYADTFGLSDIEDYGTSASSSTSRAQNILKICYGQLVAVAGSSSQAVTNLPFTSSSSYQVTISKTANSAAAVPSAFQDSGAQFTAYNNHSDAVGRNGTFNWIAIGT